MGYQSLNEISVVSHQPPNDGFDRYVASKRASERYFELAYERLSLPAWVHRPRNIIGDGVPARDVMHNLSNFLVLDEYRACLA